MGHNVCFKEDAIRKIAIYELGEGDFKDFLGYMEMVPNGAITEKIQELRDKMSRQPIDAKRGTIEDKISKLLVYGDFQCMGRKLKLAK